jgi:hypothetical protein
MRTRALRGALEQRGYRSYVSGIPRLALLLESLERPLPASWEEQLRHPALALAARS